MTAGAVYPGASGRLNEELSRIGASNLLVVASGASFTASGGAERVAGVLKGRRVHFVEGVAANPDLESLESHFSPVADLDPDAILAVGGGSVVDMAKLLSLAFAADGALKAAISRPGDFEALPPIVAIPTTAGSGAEATPFAVLYVDGRKISVEHPKMLPEVALVDPDLSSSMPPYLTAVTGLDCIAHCVESLWSVRSTPESRRLASQGLRAAWTNLPSATHRPSPEARLQMATAAHLAGRAIAIGRTTLSHALSYEMTAGFGVPHGLAAALTLGGVLGFNAGLGQSDVVDERGMDHVGRVIEELCGVLGIEDVQRAQIAFDDFISGLELPTRLSQLAIHSNDLPRIVSSVDPLRLANNPRRVSEQGLAVLLNEIL